MSEPVMDSIEFLLQKVAAHARVVELQSKELAEAVGRLKGWFSKAKERMEEDARDDVRKAQGQAEGDGGIMDRPPFLSCPCCYGSPCSSACSCADPVMSGGCRRCCRYGSLEQRIKAAERLIRQEEKAKAYDDLKK